MGLSNAERQERWRKRRQQQMDQRVADLKERIAKLHEDLEGFRTGASIAELQGRDRDQQMTEGRLVKPSSTPLRNTDLEARIIELEGKLAQERREHDATHQHLCAALEAHHGWLTGAENRLLRACLHPDNVQDPALKKRYEEAFKIYSRVELPLLKKKERPPAQRRTTAEDWAAMKRATQAAKAAKKKRRKRRGHRSPGLFGAILEGLLTPR